MSTPPMYSEDFKWAMGTIRRFIRTIGAWPIYEDKMSRSLLMELRLPIMIFLLFFGLFVPQSYALYLVHDDLEVVTSNISCPTIIATVKLSIMWYNKKELRPVIESVITDWNDKKENWETELMKRKVYWPRIVCIVDFFLFVFCYLGYAIGPLLGYNVRVLSNVTDHGDRHLIVHSYYPYDYSKSPQFELTHLSQMIITSFILISVSIPDHYFAILVMHMSAQISILGLKVEGCIQGDNLISYSQSKQMDRKLKVFIERHIHLLRMINSLEKAFGYLVASQISVMAVMLICLGFIIMEILDDTGNKPTPLQVITLSGTLFNMMLHTFYDFMACENLASSSSDLFFNIYSSKWYLLPKNNSYTLIIMMMVSKTPIQIKVGKIITTSFDTYCSIIKSMGGYISMLIAVSSRDKM